MNNMQNNSEAFKSLLVKTAAGNEEALKFLTLWYRYAHKFDDLIDEDFSVKELIEAQLEHAALLTCEFFGSHKFLLLPQMYLAAEAYEASETSEKDSFLGTYLSHEGNNMLRTVALITGGYKLLSEVSEEIRRLTYLDHPVLENLKK
jgi:hypothetical protein